ncbi:hypothetical protein C6P97_07335 [Burkholderia multivorans]|uniref:Uncharacterized protein n=1 Tax=Burkholderia multivorans TaxID=87883 RepID=A0AB37AQZ8_9BURK|nr:hypothetical protein [Burkholderia multivorans]PRE45417.1 hypothetical protein C6P99_19120 [Burkholderia multivorans]PRE52104.1 hypothetical protein C6P97_07335 [Burkholderia multivorans]
MHETSHYWFLAKDYGWGWGFPVLWQGWAVLLVYIFSLLLIGKVFRPDRRLGPFLFAVVLLSAAFFGVVWATGEPPQWRS